MENSKPLMYTIKQLDKDWLKYLRKNSGELGLSDTYRRIIMFLNRNPGANQKMIAEFCNMTSAAVSQTIKEMQLAGYIYKETDEKDQRYYKLYLTDKSKEKVELIHETIQNADSFITKAVSPEKEAEIVKILTELTEAIRKEF